MKFGLAFASSVGLEPDSALQITTTAAECGFESVWGGEHVIMPTGIESAYPYSPDGKIPAGPDTPIPDPLIWLAYVAAAAPTLRLGTCILILPQRNPLVLAKELATLDQLSGGRVELGIGVGWMKEEFDALGIPWAARGARTDEYIEAMRLLWSGPAVEFHGRFVDFDEVTCAPRPPAGDIPITVGGDTERAVSRAARLGNGYFPGTGDPDTLAGLIGSVKSQAEKLGRDPNEIEINAMFVPPAEDALSAVEALAAIGVNRLMVPAFFFGGEDGQDRLGSLGEAVIRPSIDI
jgi:probable F420-dependent oxidoreductase